MCFETPKVETPKARVPRRDNTEAKRRRRNEEENNRIQAGRAATIATTPLGDPGFGQSIRRATLGV